LQKEIIPHALLEEARKIAARQGHDVPDHRGRAARHRGAHADARLSPSTSELQGLRQVVEAVSWERIRALAYDGRL
jgi:hypothetical protein